MSVYRIDDPGNKRLKIKPILSPLAMKFPGCLRFLYPTKVSRRTKRSPQFIKNKYGVLPKLLTFDSTAIGTATSMCGGSGGDYICCNFQYGRTNRIRHSPRLFLRGRRSAISLELGLWLPSKIIKRPRAGQKKRPTYHGRSGD